MLSRRMGWIRTAIREFRIDFVARSRAYNPANANPSITDGRSVPLQDTSRLASREPITVADGYQADLFAIH